MGFDGPDPDRIRPDDHVTIARCMLDKFAGEHDGKSVDPIYCENSFWRWEGKKWESIPESDLKRKICMVNSWAVPENGGVFAVRSSFVSSVYEVAKIFAARDDFFADRKKHGVALSNGFVEVGDDIVLRPPAPSDGIRHTVNAQWGDDYDCEGWLEFLGDLFKPDEDKEARARFLGEFIGCCLLGNATEFNKALMLVGRGSNGKSVLCEVIEGLFPQGTATSVAPQDMSKATRVSALKESYVNIVSDIPTRDLMDAGAFKQVVAGDAVEGKFLYEDTFRFKPRAGHIFSANELPQVKDNSHGFFRRWVVLRFNRQFRPGEDGAIQKSDLVKRIMKERDGIICWCIKRAKEAMDRRSFFRVTSHEVEISEWAVSSDHVTAFVNDALGEERFLPSASSPGILTAQMYKAYEAWTAKNGHGKMSHTKLTNRLKALNVPYRPTNRGREWGAEFKPAEGFKPEMKVEDGDFDLKDK